jgi:hypothetical protein
MQSYSSRGNRSGVTGYEIGEDFIIIQIMNRMNYKYTYASCTKQHVDKMISCANNQMGLGTYLSKYSPAYAWKR